MVVLLRPGSPSPNPLVGRRIAASLSNKKLREKLKTEKDHLPEFSDGRQAGRQLVPRLLPEQESQ